MGTRALTRALALLALTTAATVGVAVPAHAAGSISGRAYVDADADGAFGEGERALADLPVYADLNDDGFRDDGEPVTVSASDGSWALTGLAAGTYRVRQDPEPGWRCSAPAGCAHTVDLADGDSSGGHDFGSWRPARVLGAVFDDADGDGARGPGELPRIRAVLYLDVDRDGVQDADEPLTASGIDGSFAFNGMKPGTWVVRETLSDGWQCSAPAGCAYTVRLRSSDEVPGLVFGNRREAAPPAVDPTSIGSPVLRVQLAPDSWAPVDAEADPETGGEIFSLERPTGCVPLVVQVPIGEEQGRVHDAHLLFVTADGKEQTIVIEDAPPLPADGFWSGTIPCLAAGRLDVVANTDAGTVRAVVGRIALTEPEVKPDVSPKPTCLMRPVTARIRGASIRRVVYYLDGRHFKTVRRPDSTGRFRVTVYRRALTSGRHVLRAKVVFVRAADRPPAYLTLPFTRCLASSPATAVTASTLPACAAKPFRAWVRGDRVRRVRFQLDGTSLGAVSVADWRGRYGVRVDPRELAEGSHVVLARVEFVRGSGLRTRTVRLPFGTCD